MQLYPFFSIVGTDVSIDVPICSTQCFDEESLLPEDESESTISANSKWCGFKIIGDNIDKNIKPRYYRSNTTVKSLHYYHSYALKDRIDMTDISDRKPQVDVPLCLYIHYIYAFVDS